MLNDKHLTNYKVESKIFFNAKILKKFYYSEFHGQLVVIQLPGADVGYGKSMEVVSKYESSMANTTRQLLSVQGSPGDEIPYEMQFARLLRKFATCTEWIAHKLVRC